MRFIKSSFIVVLLLSSTELFAYKKSMNGQIFDIIADNDFVPINVDFTGRKMRIHGATDIKGTIIITVLGQNKTFNLHKKQKTYGMWVDGKYATVQAPSFYTMLTSAPINISTFKNGIYPIGIENTPYLITDIAGGDTSDKLWAKTILAQSRIGKYSYQANGVVERGDALFNATINLPSDIPTGTYTLSAFVYNKKGLHRMTSVHFSVGRTGFTHFVYIFAKEYPLLYGIVAILLSLLIGAGVTYQRKQY